MKTRTYANEEAVRELWRPDAVRKLARELGTIASDTLVEHDGPVRRPGSPRLSKNRETRSKETKTCSLGARNSEGKPSFIAPQIRRPASCGADSRCGFGGVRGCSDEPKPCRLGDVADSY